MALLAAYLREKSGESLGEFLNQRVFAGAKSSTIAPDEGDAEGFAQYIARYKACLPVERAAIQHLK